MNNNQTTTKDMSEDLALTLLREAIEKVTRLEIAAWETSKEWSDAKDSTEALRNRYNNANEERDEAQNDVRLMTQQFVNAFKIAISQGR